MEYRNRIDLKSTIVEQLSYNLIIDKESHIEIRIGGQMVVALGSIIGIGITALTVAASKGAESLSREELNSVQREKYRVIQNVNEDIANVTLDVQSTLKTNRFWKEKILEKYITPFKEEFNKISNIRVQNREIEGEFAEFEKMSLENDGFLTLEKGLGTILKDGLVDTVVFSIFGAAGIFVKAWISIDKMESQKKIEQLQIEKIRTEAMEIRKKLTVLNEMVLQVKEVNAVLKFFYRLLSAISKKFFDFINEKGYDARMYTDEEMKELMMYVDVYKVVNALIVKPVVMNDGTINHELINGSLFNIELITENIKGIGDGERE